MDQRTVLITGGNTGIGRATAQALAERGADVVITSRDTQRGKEAVEAIERAIGRRIAVLPLDLASFQSIRSFAAAFLARYESLHVLINNAGLILSDRRTTAEGFEQTFGVNHLGHFLLTNLLLDRLKQSAPARVIHVASEAHRIARKGLDFDDLQARTHYRGLGVYARSKLANVYFARELARRLEGTGVTSNALHPGTVATRFARDGDVKGIVRWFYKLLGRLLKTPTQGAATSIHLASAPELEGVSGKYFKNRKEIRPTRVARDDEAAARLWAASEGLVAQHRPA